MSRLPIRIRLTLPFALAMAVVLTALGAFVYIRVGSTLLHSTDQTLLTEATQATLRFEDGRQLIDRDATSGAGVTQVIGANGAVVSSAPIGFPALLGVRAVQAVLVGRPLHETTSLAGQSGRWRLLAVPETSGSVREVLVLAGSLGDRDESLEGLRHELLLSSPLALLVATLAGYLLAGAALRPVEAMRKKAAAISAATPGSRLPVPRANDEVSRLAVTLNEMLARLETAFEHERRFVAEASHELRTPLALLRTELELALRKPRSREELEEALRSAAEETDRLTALAADLLLIARSEEKAMPVHLEAVSASELLRTVADRFSARAGELERSVSIDLDEDVAFAADPRRVEQALGNLVDNALLHGAGAVTLSARRSNEHVVLHVSDEGAGFPAEFAPRAFDRFSRAAEARRRTGSGLGLAIVRAVAEAHHGSAGVSAAEHGGADVWFSLAIGPQTTPGRPRGPLSVRRSRAPEGRAVAAAPGAAELVDRARGVTGSRPGVEQR